MCVISVAVTSKISYSGDYNNLIGTLSSDLLMYANNVSSSHGYGVHICSVDNNHQLVMTLIGSEGRKWSKMLSLCRHPQSGYTVVEDGIQTLVTSTMRKVGVSLINILIRPHKISELSYTLAS